MIKSEEMIHARAEVAVSTSAVAENSPLLKQRITWLKQMRA
jgi:hypothetical protein